MLLIDKVIGKGKYATLKLPDLVNHFWEQFLRRQPVILILLAITVFAFVINSYRFIQENIFRWINNFHLIFPYFLIFPVLAIVVYGLLETRSKLSQTHHLNNVHRELSLKLIAVKNWDEIATTLFQFITSHLPLVGLSLLVYNRISDKYEIVSEKFSSREIEPHTRCLPLIHGGEQIALLYLYLFPDIAYTPAQIDFLGSLAPEIALATERVQLLISLTEQTQAIQKKEQQRIARHLHDTLGHDLAYLRLKLDQLSNSGQLNGLAAFHQEIEQLCSLTNKACEQMRSLLKELQDEHQAVSGIDLVSHIKECALIIGARANFQVGFKTEGEPEILPPELQRQILYIVREILRNIEKHAQAKNLTLALQWIANGLIIKLTDDGQGFDVATNQKNDGHYGLKIVHEIVGELNGSISLVSDQNAGTQITLWIPFR